MTLEQEFKKQWTSVCNYVKADILKSNQLDIDLTLIQSTLDNEKKKWFLQGQYNNAWFEKLKRTNPDVALIFENNLKSIKIEPVNFKRSNYSWLVLWGTAVVGAAVGFGISRIITAAELLQSVLWTVSGIVGGLIIGTSMSLKKKDETLDKLCSAYGEQLKKTGEMLSKIVSKTN